MHRTPTFYGGIPNVRDVVRDRSKGLEHARRAKKRLTRGQNIVGVNGSETRNTELHRLFLSRQGHVSKFRHAGRVLYENERKRSFLW